MEKIGYADENTDVIVKMTRDEYKAIIALGKVWNGREIRVNFNESKPPDNLEDILNAVSVFVINLDSLNQVSNTIQKSIRILKGKDPSKGF